MQKLLVETTVRVHYHKQSAVADGLVNRPECAALPMNHPPDPTAARCSLLLYADFTLVIPGYRY